VSKKWTFKHNASYYAILGDIFYKQSYDGVLLPYLELYDQAITMQTCHDVIFGRHFNGIVIAKDILRMGYYWSNMERYYQEHVKKCV